MAPPRNLHVRGKKGNERYENSFPLFKRNLQSFKILGLGAVGLLNICQRGTSDPVLRISGDLQVGKTVEGEVDLGQLEIALSARAGKDCTDTGTFPE